MFEMSVFSAMLPVIVNCLLVIVPIAVFLDKKDHSPLRIWFRVQCRPIHLDSENSHSSYIR
jgi:hypothetical protein